MTDLTSYSKEVALDQGLNRAILIITMFSPSQREPQTLTLSWVGLVGQGKGWACVEGGQEQAGLGCAAGGLEPCGLAGPEGGGSHPL